jgi:1-acyl-sn-glycerol-3-phosphate acyltransferase
VRLLVRALCRLILRVFFRKVEVAGTANIPTGGAVIYVLNHPNGLVDPLFALVLSPRPVSFLAKAPLFRMPVVGALVRALDSLPVYRHQDEGADPTRNRETFAAARAILGRGGAIAIFPEGTSHSDPKLRPLKTGAARIALGAAAAGAQPLAVVPAGLYYTRKDRFRSRALLCFGPPIPVAPVALENEEPPRDAVRALTGRIEAALAEVTLQADQAEVLALVAAAERIFSAEPAARAEADAPLARELDLRKRLSIGYKQLQGPTGGRVAALADRIQSYERELAQLGIEPKHLAPDAFRPGPVLGYATRSALLLALAALPALAGAIVHAPAFFGSRFAALRLAHGDDDLVATIKVLGAMLFYPLTWAGLALVAGWRAGVLAAIVALVLAPLGALVALFVGERLEELVVGTRALALFVVRRRAFARLLAERRAIRNEILALAEILEPT